MKIRLISKKQNQKKNTIAKQKEVISQKVEKDQIQITEKIKSQKNTKKGQIKKEE